MEQVSYFAETDNIASLLALVLEFPQKEHFDECLEYEEKTFFYSPLFASLSELITKMLVNDNSRFRTAEKKCLALDCAVNGLFDFLHECASLSEQEKSEAAKTILAALYECSWYSCEFVYEDMYLDAKELLKKVSGENMRHEVACLDGIGKKITRIRSALTAFNKARKAYLITEKYAEHAQTSLRKRILDSLNGEVLPFMDKLAQEKPALYGAHIQKMDAEIRRINRAAEGAR